MVGFVFKSDELRKVVFVLGGPGAGKGTMCEISGIQLNWSHLSAGDLLRAERKKEGSPNADLINDYVRVHVRSCLSLYIHAGD